MYIINPFSEFAISLGPAYIERLFDALLIKSGLIDLRQLPDAARLEKYILLLKNKSPNCSQREYLFIQFYTAHFYHQLSEHSPKEKDKKEFRQTALSYYRSYLDLTTGSEESRFYAQWQTGTLQILLCCPWTVAHESFLKANRIDPLRGEPIQNIITHFTMVKDWENAYLYSLFSKCHYFNRNPIAVRRWYVDFDSYNWNVLDNHIRICTHLGLFLEAEHSNKKLLNYVIEKIPEFKNVGNHILRVVKHFTISRNNHSNFNN
jgi:hypothetical protein